MPAYDPVRKNYSKAEPACSIATALVDSRNAARPFHLIGCVRPTVRCAWNWQAKTLLKFTQKMDDSEPLGARQAISALERQAAPLVLLDSGQRVAHLCGLTAEAIASTPTADLQFEHFAVAPSEIEGWRSMSKSGLQKAMKALQADKWRAEKQHRRELAAPRPCGAGSSIASVPKPELPRRQNRTKWALTVNAWLAAVQTGSGAGPRVVVDCSFDDLMTAGERVSITQQLVRCYASVRRAAVPLRLYLTSMDEARLQALRAITGSAHWGIGTTMQPFEAVFCGITDAASSAAGSGSAAAGSSEVATRVGCLELPRAADGVGKMKVVYLSADSATEIDALDSGTTYVVGGIVDRNRFKGLTESKARALGIATARLPLEHHLKLLGAWALTTCHVVAILQHWCDSRNWGAACAAAVPARKHEPVAMSTSTADPPTSSAALAAAPADDAK